MGIQERLLSLAAPLRHRGLVGGAAIVAAAAAAGYSLVHARAAPFGLGAVVAFFWPLLASTGLFLAAVAVLLRISPPPPPGAAASGEELLDYVAGRPCDDAAAPAPYAASAEAGFGGAGGGGADPVDPEHRTPPL